MHQRYRRTDGQTTCSRNTVLCTIVHCGVKIGTGNGKYLMKMWQRFGVLVIWTTQQLWLWHCTSLNRTYLQHYNKWQKQNCRQTTNIQLTFPLQKSVISCWVHVCPSFSRIHTATCSPSLSSGTPITCKNDDDTSEPLAMPTASWHAVVQRNPALQAATE